MVVTYHVVVSGVVQGIGFRAWVKRHARRLLVTGWVKNREDGAVELVIQGKNETILSLIDLLHQGPPLAAVSSVVKEQMIEAPQYEHFIVIQ